MLCVEDAIDALTWANDIGGLDGLIARVDANFNVIKTWVESMTVWRFCRKPEDDLADFNHHQDYC